MFKIHWTVCQNAKTFCTSFTDLNNIHFHMFMFMFTAPLAKHYNILYITMHNVVQCIPADCTEYERWQCTAVACAGARGIKLNTPVISLSPLVVSLNCTLWAPPCYAVLELDEMKQGSFLIGVYTVHSRYNAWFVKGQLLLHCVLQCTLHLAQCEHVNILMWTVTNGLAYKIQARCWKLCCMLVV